MSTPKPPTGSGTGSQGSTGNTPDLGQMAMAAVALHELFSSYVNAGFTRQEALHLVAQLLRAQLEQGGQAT